MQLLRGPFSFAVVPPHLRLVLGDLSSLYYSQPQVVRPKWGVYAAVGNITAGEKDFVGVWNGSKIDEWVSVRDPTAMAKWVGTGTGWLIRIEPVSDQCQTSVKYRICAGVHVTMSCQMHSHVGCTVMSDAQSCRMHSVISDMHLS